MRLLDTSTRIAILRGRPASVAERFIQSGGRGLCLCSVVVAELMTGALKSQHPFEESAKVNEFVSGFPVLDFGLAQAQAYASIRTDLESSGWKIGGNDLLIAAIAVSYGLVLVTHDTSDFSRVRSLEIEDWVAE